MGFDFSRAFQRKPTTGAKEPAFQRFLKRLFRFVPGPTGGRRRDEKQLAQERQFLAERRAALERELRRRAEAFTTQFPELRGRIEAFARDPLPDHWRSDALPRVVAYGLRPLRRDLDLLDALERAIAQRPLSVVIEEALRRMEDETLEALRGARPAERYGDDFWTRELVEQSLSHLYHLWAEWLAKHGDATAEGGEAR